MVLAGIVEEKLGKDILPRLLDDTTPILMTTPYMVHHFIEALILGGERDIAIREIKKYWEMEGPIRSGSSTPTYLIRKY